MLLENLSKANVDKTFEVLEWQRKPWSDISPVILITGSAGGGKSRFAAEKIHGYCLRYPGSTGLIVRKTRESMTNSTVIFMNRKIIGEDHRIKHIQTKSRWEYPNRSVLAYGGMKDEAQREQIRSMGQDGSVDIIWIEEASLITEEDFNELLARLRGKAAPWNQIILTTNPDSSTHWIYRRLILGKEANVYYSRAQDNPYNPPQYSDSLDLLTGLQRARLRDGRWVQAEGAVYDMFDSQVHVVDNFTIPKGWRKYRSVDFGFTNPFVCQWWAVDYDGRGYLYREIYKTKTLVEDHARRIKTLSAGERIEVTVCDHDAEGRATLERYLGYKTSAAYKKINDGVQAVKNRLQVCQDGRPRLMVCKDALLERDPELVKSGKPTCTLEEFPSYSWPAGKEGKSPKEIPEDKDNHGMDAARYFVRLVDPRRRKFRRSKVS